MGNGRDLSYRVGEKHLDSNGDVIIITEYFSARHCTVTFGDGYEIKKQAYLRVTEGKVSRPPCRVGLKNKNNQGYCMEIIDYREHRNCIIKFDCGLVVENIRYDHFREGGVNYPYHKSTFENGYIGIGKYKPFKDGRHTPAYAKWNGVMERAYSKKLHQKHPTYKTTTVDKEWNNFQVFAEWFQKSYNVEIMKNWDLDKDILIKGNKHYSAETCAFVPKEINILYTKRDLDRGVYVIGVIFKKGKYVARLSKKGKRTHLGVFDTELEAFHAYKTAKENYIKEVAHIWKDKIDIRVFEAMMAYEVEITD